MHYRIAGHANAAWAYEVAAEQRPSEDLILHACFPAAETASPKRFSTLHFHETGHADAAWEYEVAADRVCFPA